jgi:hypothetical protein
MDLLDQAVEDPNAVASFDQRPRHVAANEPGPAGDQDSVAQVQTSVSAAVETCMT